jgi:hypothetical protein
LLQTRTGSHLTRPLPAGGSDLGRSQQPIQPLQNGGRLVRLRQQEISHSQATNPHRVVRLVVGQRNHQLTHTSGQRLRCRPDAAVVHEGSRPRQHLTERDVVEVTHPVRQARRKLLGKLG